MPEKIHEYYKKEYEDSKILIQIDRESLRGTELIVLSNGKTTKTKRNFDSEIFEDLDADDFVPCSPLVFNLYLKGLVG